MSADRGGAVTRLYIAGPMSGLPDHGYPAFHSAALQLRAAGFDVVNPAELDGEVPWDDSRERWGDCIVRDVAALNTCGGLALLEGWHSSSGAQVEHAFALGKMMPIAYVDTWLDYAGRSPEIDYAGGRSHEIDFIRAVNPAQGG